MDNQPEKSKNNLSHNRDYFITVMATTIAMAIVVSVFIIYLAIQNEKNNLKSLKIEALNINNIISDSFEHSNRVNSFIGRQIVNHSAKDLDFILSLFLEANKIQSKNSELLSWTSFDWVDANNMQLVNSRLGIRKNPPNMSKRQYTYKAPKNPWSLQVSFPTLGNPSNMWVIPAGTGVVDNKNNYLGIVVVGFRVVEFESKLQQKLVNDDVSFVVLDNDSNIILQSSGKNLNLDDDLYKKNNVSKNFTQESGELENPIFVNGTKYSFYKKMEKYPYVVLTGFNQTFLDKKFNNLILPRIIEFIAITAFFLIILYLFKTRASILLKNEQSLKSKLQTSNLRLKELNKSVNHDLRNYISGILGLADLITEDRDLKKESAKEILRQDQEYAKMISEQAKIILKFSKSLLTDEGIQGALDTDFRIKNNFDFEEINIDKLINDLIILKKPFLREQKVSIRTDISENLPTLKTNLIELRKILDNLIINAAKYSNNNGEIVIKASTKKTFLEIQIIDNGIGMTKDEIVKALAGDGKSIEKSGLNKEFDSHGIGLPIVERAVESLGAKMNIESKKGKGTKITLHFENKKEKVIKNKRQKIHPVSSHAKQTILLADDNKMISVATQHQLDQLGYNVLVASNSAEVIALLDNNYCDLILMDTNMEELGDGLKTTKLIREGLVFKNFKNFKTIPIISLSADFDSESQKLALKSGSTSCLEKPFNRDNFLKMMVEIVN